MRTICTNVFNYDELSDEAKEKAREWYRQFVYSDSCDWEFIFDDAVECAALMGITIDRDRHSQSEPAIYFSGFWSQGDGASFVGSYRYKKGAVKAIKAHTNDNELIRIAQALQNVQRQNFYRLYATITRGSNFYSHSNTMRIDVEDVENPYRDLKGDDVTLAQLMRDFADWIYGGLEKEYDYQASDEAVEEALRANEYEFTADGEKA